jgi:hypothetical protein
MKRQTADWLGQSADRGGNRAAFDVEQGSDQHTGPLPGFSFPLHIEVDSKDRAVALEVLEAAVRYFNGSTWAGRRIRYVDWLRSTHLPSSSGWQKLSN